MGCDIFIFPHQDDEAGVYPFLLDSSRRGQDVVCVFVTSGSREDSEFARRRATESERALARIGVPSYQIRHAGLEKKWDDGDALYHLDAIADYLSDLFIECSPDRIFVPAREGGHHDHDATFLASYAAAIEKGISDRLFEFFIYRAPLKGVIPYIVGSPLPGYIKRLTTNIRIREAFIFVSSIFEYRSQKKAMIGLAPFFIFKWFVNRRLSVYQKNAHSVNERPHHGRLLYERHRRMGWEDFNAVASDFVVRRIPAGRR